MIDKIWHDASGAVIHIGDWDLQTRPRTVVALGGEIAGYEQQEDQQGNPVFDEATGQPVLRAVLAQPGDVYVPDPTDLVDHNPIPDGATMIEDEVVERADGGLAAASDYASLRRAAYPTIREQLDAIWKGGEDAAAMAEQVAAVKAAYPKPAN